MRPAAAQPLPIWPFYIFFLFLSFLFCKQIVFLIMFLYVPKLLIRLLESFYWGLSVTAAGFADPGLSGAP